MTYPNDPNNGFTGNSNNPTNEGTAGNTGGTGSSYPSYGSTNSGSSPYGDGGSTSYGHGAQAPNAGEGAVPQQGYTHPENMDATAAAGYNQAGYGQSAYAPGPGYVDPDSQSESGRPLALPGGPLPVIEPMVFGFKRVFTSQWHVYIGLMVLPVLVVTVGSLLALAPVLAAIAANPYSYEPGVEVLASVVPFALAAGIVILIVDIVLTKVALRDSQGEKPTWKNAFKNVRWGQGILAYILVGLFLAVLFAVVGLIAGLLLSALPDQPIPGIIVFVIGMIGLVFLLPFVTLIPIYAIDGRTGAGGAFGAAWSDLKPHYWRALAALLVIGIISGAASQLSGGVLSVIFGPVQTLAGVFIYRWITTQNTQQAQQPDGYMSMY